MELREIKLVILLRKQPFDELGVGGGDATGAVAFVFKDDKLGFFSSGFFDRFHDHLAAVGGDNAVVSAIVGFHGNFCEVLAPAIEVRGDVFWPAWSEASDHGGDRGEMIGRMSRPRDGALSAHAVSAKVDPLFVDREGLP